MNRRAVISCAIALVVSALCFLSGACHSAEPFTVIVLTHSYLRGNERIAGDGYGVQGHNGQALWEKFIGWHESVFMVLCGHTNVGRLTSRGRHGNEVHQILSDYQGWHNGGDGYLRIMRFVPREDRIDVETFSPVLSEYVKTPESAFSLEYSMR
ncbi:MAG: hypothetical protein JSW27_15030 [Phycisphaerales bacterium]|nr:MAG: hypothetical protein JSW27_15030 [Phycisphaerales bacterium]